MAYAPVKSALGAGSEEITRESKGLKEFLWNLDGVAKGSLLDLGPAWQTTLSFFIERGFRVTSEDLLRARKEFQAEEEKRLQAISGGAPDHLDMTPQGRAARFLESNLRYPASTFDALLLWDLLDYLEPALARRVVACVSDYLRPGGVVFALFHSRKPERFQRYRVVDSTMLQVLPGEHPFAAQRVYQNREILDLFGHFRTMKSFVSRDQLREVVFIK